MRGMNEMFISTKPLNAASSWILNEFVSSNIYLVIVAVQALS